MKNSDFNKELEAFVEAIDSFPASDTKSMFYSIDNIASSKNAHLLMELMGKEQYNQALNMVHALGKAVEICREGQLELGHKQFTELLEKSRHLNTKAKSYFNIYFLSGIAYYYFKIGNFDEAITCIFKETDEIEKFELMSVKNLHYKRVGVMINLVKIYNANKDFDKSTQLYLNLLLYLIDGKIRPIDYGKWDAQLLESTPYIKQRLLDLVFMDAISASMTSKDIKRDNLKYYFEEIFSKIPEIEISNNNQAMIWNWIYLQKLYYTKQYIQFVKDATSFLQTQFDNSFDISKLAILLEVTNLVNEFEIQKEKKDILYRKINDFIQTKLILLQYQKTKICSLLSE